MATFYGRRTKTTRGGVGTRQTACCFEDLLRYRCDWLELTLAAIETVVLRGWRTKKQPDKRGGARSEAEKDIMCQVEFVL